MSSFYDRLVIENAELNDKILKLLEFLKTDIFNNLDQQIQDLIKSHFEHMYDYSKTLAKRIEMISTQDRFKCLLK